MILDAHAHCGLTLPFEEIHRLWRAAGIEGGVLIPPVEEIYDRYDSTFTDGVYYRDARRRVHDYLESIDRPHIYRLWFVWNDFAFPRESFHGIKWHRHPYEPVYDYASDACERFIQFVVEKKLPILLEEEFRHTLELVKRIGGRTAIIIPHMGELNGGYWSLKRAGLFDNPHILVDTALASEAIIVDFVKEYGADRVLFGSDFPFGDPGRELNKVYRLFSGEERDLILSLNVLRLGDKRY